VAAEERDSEAFTLNDVAIKNATTKMPLVRILREILVEVSELLLRCPQLVSNRTFYSHLGRVVNDAMYSFLGSLEPVVLSPTTEELSSNAIKLRECFIGGFAHFHKLERWKQIELVNNQIKVDQINLDKIELATLMTFYDYNKSKDVDSKMSFLEEIESFLDSTSPDFNFEAHEIQATTVAKVKKVFDIWEERTVRSNRKKVEVFSEDKAAVLARLAAAEEAQKKKPPPRTVASAPKKRKLVHNTAVADDVADDVADKIENLPVSLDETVDKIAPPSSTKANDEVVVQLLEDDFADSLLSFTYFLNCECIGSDGDCAFQLILPEYHDKNVGSKTLFSPAYSYSKLIYEKCMELRSSSQTEQRQMLAEFLLDNFGYTIFRKHNPSYYYKTEGRGLCWLLANYQLNYLQENGMVASSENIDVAHPTMPSFSSSSSSSSSSAPSHGPAELIAFGQKMKAEAQLHFDKGIFPTVYQVLPGDKKDRFSDLAEVLDNYLPKVAYSKERNYGLHVWFSAVPFMIMRKFYRCSFFSEYLGVCRSFHWHRHFPRWVQLRTSSAVDIDEANIDNIEKKRNTFANRGSRLCPMLFSVEHGPDKREIRDIAFRVFTSKPMVMFKSCHFYFLPYKTEEEWKASRAASFLVMAKRILQKHKTLFPADPVVPTIPENQALPMSLRAYDEQFNCAAKNSVVKKK
jgi:hypothetical protein